MKRLGKLIVTGLGAGYLPIAPGTWGSLGPCVVFLALAYVVGGGLGAQVAVAVVMLLVALAFSVGCVVLGPAAEREFARKDPRTCTADEWAGQAVALIMLPIGAGFQPLITAGVAFVLFRVADIVKPPPARRMEKLPFGWGVLMDDIVAGVYANIAAHLILRMGLGQ